MPRIARVVEAGFPHHVVQRGNNKETVDIRYFTRTGRPLGTDEFTLRMEALLQRSFEIKSVGRPGKNRD
jgi:hypothetical protein